MSSQLTRPGGAAGKREGGVGFRMLEVGGKMRMVVDEGGVVRTVKKVRCDDRALRGRCATLKGPMLLAEQSQLSSSGIEFRKTTRASKRPAGAFERPGSLRQFRLLLTLVGILLSINLPATTNYQTQKDSLPTPRPVVKPDYEEPSVTEKNRGAVIIEHTRIGTPPPPPGEAIRRKEEAAKEAAERKAEEAAILADRLERRRQRLEELKAESAAGKRLNRRQLARQIKEERKKERDRIKAEEERAEALARQEVERERREALRAKLLAKREAERLEREAEAKRMAAERERERQARLAQQQAEEKRRAELEAAREAERARLAKKAPAPPKPAPAPPPKLTPEQQRAAREAAKQQRLKMARLAKEGAAARKRQQREARIAYRAGRADRKAARQRALAEARQARLAIRKERQRLALVRKSERQANKYARQEERREAKAERTAARTARLAEKASRKATRRAERDARLAEKALAKAAHKQERDARRADKLAARAARKDARDQARAARLADRLARRAARLAERAARRAERLARREARRAARLARRAARREARRLRRLNRPPAYWTAEPAVAVGLTMKSGGAGGEKALEALAVQALVGYHRGKGLSLRSGFALSVMNSKIQEEISLPSGRAEARFYNQLTSIDIPLLVGYRLPNNKFNALVEAGPVFNLSSGGDAHIRMGQTFSPVGGGYFLPRRKGFGFILQASGEYRLSETGALTAGLRIQSFGGAFTNPEVGGRTTASTISLQVGYRIRF